MHDGRAARWKVCGRTQLRLGFRRDVKAMDAPDAGAGVEATQSQRCENQRENSLDRTDAP